MSRVRLVTVGIAVAVIAALAPASPAFAHDQLIASDPSAGERLVSAPESVLLEYSGNLLDLGGAGTIVIVVDESGRDWVEATPVVFAHTVTAELASGMPEAGYEIRWRVVSSDGHPISGVIPFTIGDAAPLALRPSPSDSVGADSQAEVQDQTRTDPPRILRVALIGAGGAVIAAALFALLTILRRRAQRSGTGAVVSDDIRRKKS